MFSVYAVGVKKGYRRETRVQVHAVVDFRNAPNLGAPAPLPGTPGAAGATPTTPGTPGTTPQQGGADAIAAANQPSTGGTVVYFRIE
jgi:general secretion pathway protein K